MRFLATAPSLVPLFHLLLALALYVARDIQVVVVGVDYHNSDCVVFASSVKQIGSFLLTSQARGSQQDLFFLTKPKFQTLGVALCKRPRYSPAKTKKMILCRNVRSGFRILILFLFPRFGCAYLLMPYGGGIACVTHKRLRCGTSRRSISLSEEIAISLALLC
jgi:hypothetical protein